MTFKEGDAPIYTDERGRYILRRKFTARNGRVYSDRVYKIYID